MNSDDINSKLKELEVLKKKEQKSGHRNKFRDKFENKYYKSNSSYKSDSTKKTFYKITDYEDDVIEDSEEIIEKRDKVLESNLDFWIVRKRELIKELKENNEIHKIININCLFPYDNIRESQKDLIQDTYSALNSQKNLLAHAPTGLGKTIASLGPALEYAIRNKKIVFFLTSRQTQHMIAIKTLKDIQDKFGVKLNSLDIIGKKSMCLQEGIEVINGGDFSEFCKVAKKERTCEYYNNTLKADKRVKLKAELFVKDIEFSILSSDNMLNSCRSNRFCPYEVSLLKGKTANVIICDYSYIFHPEIRATLFNKLALQLGDCVVIVDEAHNLPERTKSSASVKLSTSMLQRAIKESSKYNLEEANKVLRHLYNKISEFNSGNLTPSYSKSSYPNLNDAILFSKDNFNNMFEDKVNFEAACGILKKAIDVVRENQKRSFISGILNFIVTWQGQDEGFVRTFSKDQMNVDGKIIKYTCLDPSIITRYVFDSCDSSVIISGTLQPTEMYRDLLGIGDAILKSYKNPFPSKNALQIIVPKTTTKFDRRNPGEFQSIAKECLKILNLVEGNTAIFFPSYDLRDKIYKYLYDSDEDLILEEPNMSQEEKSNLFSEFTKSSLRRKVLLGTSSGSFGEGIDFPGHFLTCVIVVGLPLMKPTLEINKLIEYYNSKFGRGWDYGYFYPSFNKTFQNVGRCIRSETDRGIMIYLDERFAEHRYLKFFKGRDVVVRENYSDLIEDFYN